MSSIKLKQQTERTFQTLSVDVQETCAIVLSLGSASAPQLNWFLFSIRLFI